MLLKILVSGLLIAFGEIINGNIRVRVLHRKLGKRRAKIISFFSGVALIFTISWITLPWIAPRGYSHCFMVGFIWLPFYTNKPAHQRQAIYRKNATLFLLTC
jgi:hypothetical protein